VSLRWRAFERRAWRGVRAQLRASSRLWPEYRRVRKGRWQNLHLPPWLGRLMLLAYASAILWSKARSLEFMVGFLTLATLAVSFFQARQLRAHLYHAPDLVVFNYLPVADAVIFRKQWWGFVRHSAWWILGFAILYSLVALKIGVGGISCAVHGLAFGLVQWLFLVLAAVCLVAYWKRQLFHTLALIFAASAIGLFALGPAQQPVLALLGKVSYWVPPLGWTFYAMGITLQGTTFHDLWPCVTAAVLLALAPAAYRRIQETYQLDKQLLARAQGQAVDVETPAPAELAQAYAQTQEQAAGAVYARAFLGDLNWHQAGLLERSIPRLLNKQDRLVLEFLVAANPRWTAGLRNLGILIVLGTAACLFFPVLQSGAMGFIAVFAVIFVLANLFGNWRGFATPQGVGRQSPFYTLYPIGFGQLARIVVTVNLIRYCCCLPLLAGVATVLTIKAHWDITATVWTSLKVIVLGVLLQPLLPILFLSPGTNDTQKPLFMLSVIGISLTLIGCGAVFMFANTVWAIVLAGAIFGLLSLGALLVYGRMFNHNRFDLVPAQSTGNWVSE
jgi:hypothetical protein